MTIKRIPDYLRPLPHSTAAAVAESLGPSPDVVSSTLSELKKRRKHAFGSSRLDRLKLFGRAALSITGTVARRPPAKRR